MRKFHFFSVCRRSTHDLHDIKSFLKLFDASLGHPDWTQGRGPITLSYLKRELLRSQTAIPYVRSREGLGEFINLLTKQDDLHASFGLFCKRKTLLSRVGGNTFSLNFTDRDGLPPVAALIKALKLVQPWHAELTERGNCDALDSEGRCGSVVHPSDRPERIWMVHWFQYLDKKLIAQMGSLRHVLKMPCYRIEKLAGGVFWQLTEDYFEPDNPQHLAAQRAAMEHLGIWEYTPNPPCTLTAHLQELAKKWVRRKKARKSKGRV